MKRLFTVLLALSLMSLGIGLIISTGLPHSADYSGFMMQEVGYVAPEIGKQAPPFRLDSLKGKTIDLIDLRGHVVIVNFWGTWCEPCRIEMPELQALYEVYRAEGLHILAINLGENPQSVAQWVQELNLKYDILLDPLQVMSQIYQLRGQPSTYVIDPDGQIQSIYYGPVSINQLEAVIQQYLNSS